MRFFSNDARETPDDEETSDGRPERVKSEPVAVPVQRPASSPWAATPTPATPTPATPTPVTPNAGTPTLGTPNLATSGPEVPVSAAGRDDRRGDGPSAGPVAGRPPFHEPAPQPTAFGAGTVGGAVAASALANPLNDTQGDTDRRTDAASGVADDRTVAPGDGARPRSARPDNDGPDSVGLRSDGIGSRSDDRVDAALRDGGTFADPVVTGPAGDDRSVTGHRFPSARAGNAVHRSDVDHLDDQPRTDVPPVAVPVGSDAALRTASDRTLPTDGDRADRDRADRDRADRDRADRDRADRDSADVDRTDRDGTEVDQTGLDRVDADGADVDRTDVDRGDLDASGPDGSAPVDTPAASDSADKLPGTVPAPELGPLFADRDAHAFRDRWRDVQLRFVDDPKAAAAEAAGLVDEVVEALSTSLKQQREQIAGGAAGLESGDTEQLRVRLRSYRDFLDHLLSL